MTHKRSLLSKPHAGWQQDLAVPADPIVEALRPQLQPTLNALNDSYMEVSRRSTKMRGLLIFLAIIAAGFALLILPITLRLLEYGSAEMGSSAARLAPVILVAAASIYCLRIDTAIPRDEPIRFNRLRRKVYVYGFHLIWWNPFARWYVTTNTYNWDDLRAEVWRQRGFTPQGGLIITWGVSIAVVKPGTNEVIARFPLSVGQDEGSSWDFVRAYMQLGPQALPPVEEFNDPNKVPPLNLALRFAPKVVWPAAMDLESRSGP